MIAYRDKKLRGIFVRFSCAASRITLITMECGSSQSLLKNWLQKKNLKEMPKPEASGRPSKDR
jgi:hypothetical protein